MTKIGIISDIHANLDALQRALAILRSQQPNQILCAGDIVERGSDGDSVVQLLKASDIPCVMGNHDFDAVGNQAWLRANADLSHPAMQGRLLKDETLAYLTSLPKTLAFVWEKCRVVLTHGAPWNTNEYVFPTSVPQIFQRIVSETQADVVILGHTHIPMSVQVNDTRIINPGAVCGNYPDGKGTCAVLHLPDLLVQIFSLESGALLTEYS
jgi:putative phosphoesterase